MAIRFRCAFCNQLMGIATRKIGTVVRCPKCSQQTVVPASSDIEPSPSATLPAQKTSRPDRRSTPLPRNRAFDTEDFGKVFELPEGPAEAGPELIGVEPNIHPTQRPRNRLTPLRLILAVVFVLLILAAAFLAGWCLRS